MEGMTLVDWIIVVVMAAAVLTGIAQVFSDPLSRWQGWCWD